MAFQNSALKLLGNVRGAPGNANASTDRPYEMNRYMGGHRRFNHPYISGYWYIIIEPPQRLFLDEGQENRSSVSTQEGGGSGRTGTESFETARWLHSTAEGFTPPSRTLTKVDVPGLGGLGSSYVAGQQLTRTFTTTHREYQDTPVFSAINRWTSMIDHHYGASPLGGDEYIPANYKGAAWVFLCKPTVSKFGTDEVEKETIAQLDVEQFYFFEGVFPEAAPFDAFNSDIATNDVVQLSITWSFDGWPYGREHKAAFDQGMKLMDTTYDFNFEGTAKGHTITEATTFNNPTSGRSGVS